MKKTKLNEDHVCYKSNADNDLIVKIKDAKNDVMKTRNKVIRKVSN